MTEGGKLSVWDLPSGRTVRTIDVPGLQPATLLRFSDDGRLLAVAAHGLPDPATGRSGYGLKVIEWATGTVRFEVPTAALHAAAVAFAPDGRTLAVGWADGTVPLFDLDAPPFSPPAEPMPADRAWEALATGSARAGWAAVRALAARPAEAVALVRERVKPARRPADPKPGEVAALVAALDAPKFADRERAGRALVALGRQVEPAVRAAAAAGSAEARRRAEEVLAALGRPPVAVPAEARAVEVLERAGTADARALLAELAAGHPDAPLTADAKAAVARLAAGP